MIKIPASKIKQIINQPESELDLHGLITKEALVELDAFLIKAESLGWRKIRLIVGQGWNSPNYEPILKNFITNKLKEYSYNYKFARLKQGGKGVIEVKLY